MTGNRGSEDVDCQSAARSFAQTQSQRQQWLLAQTAQQFRMGRFGALMPGQTMIERAGIERLQAGCRRTTYEPVEQNRDTQLPGCGDGAGHGRDLASTQPRQHRQTVSIRSVPLDGLCHNTTLQQQPIVINTRTPPGPVRRLAAKQRKADRGGRSGVSDAHFAHDQQIRLRIDRPPTGLQGNHQVALIHRGTLGEIRGGPVQIERMNIHARARGPGELIDCCTSGPEIRDHLHGDLGGEGRNAARRNTMITREDDYLRRFDCRARLPTPACIPDRQILQSPQRAWGFGQQTITAARALDCRLIGRRGGGQQSAKFFGCRKVGQHRSLVADWRCEVFKHMNRSDKPAGKQAMEKTTKQARDAARDVALALVLLTRLPLPALPDAAFRSQARAGWAFPLAGLAVAIPAGLLGWAAMSVGLPATVAAGLVVAAQVMLTGAMHEDGLADCADGFWGSWDIARRLEIMADSRIGTYGTLALILSVGLRWAALAALLPQTGIGAVIAAAVLSRAGLPALMTALPPARAGGLSRGVGTPGWPVAALAVMLGLTLAFVVPVWSALTAATFAAVAVAATGRLARTKIGGQTGDVLGATQQISEIVVLFTLLALV